MTRAQEQMSPTVENNAILSLLVDGPRTARELYAESGLNWQTGRELGRLMQAGLIVKVSAEAFGLPRDARRRALDRLVDELLQEIDGGRAAA